MEYQTFKTQAQETLSNYVTKTSFFEEYIQSKDRLRTTDRIEIQDTNSDSRYSVYYAHFGISEIRDTSC